MFVRIVCGVLFSVLLCTSAFAGELSPADRQQALRLIDALGGKDMILQYVRQNMGVVKKFRPDITPDKMPLVEQEITACVNEKILAPGGLAEQLLPVFTKQFTPQELRELTAFYESPLGRKTLDSLPSALREAKTVAQRMAVGMIPELNNRVTQALQREARANAGSRPEAAAAQ